MNFAGYGLDSQKPQDISPNSNEVADWRFFSKEALDDELSQKP